MHIESEPNYLLRVILAVVGAGIVFLGLNVGLGGIQTLGWQGDVVAFLTVTNAPVYAVHDSHIRFVGGVWLALGLLMLAGSVAFRRLRAVLIAFTAMIFVGGLARLSAGDLPLLLSANIAPSFFFEIVLIPLLGLWFTKAERRYCPAVPRAWCSVSRQIGRYALCVSPLSGHRRNHRPVRQYQIAQIEAVKQRSLNKAPLKPAAGDDHIAGHPAGII